MRHFGAAIQLQSFSDRQLLFTPLTAFNVVEVSVLAHVAEHRQLASHRENFSGLVQDLRLREVLRHPAQALALLGDQSELAADRIERLETIMFVSSATADDVQLAPRCHRLVDAPPLHHAWHLRPLVTDVIISLHRIERSASQIASPAPPGHHDPSLERGAVRPPPRLAHPRRFAPICALRVELEAGTDFFAAQTSAHDVNVVDKGAGAEQLAFVTSLNYNLPAVRL